MKIDMKEIKDIFSSRLTALQNELANGHVAEQKFETGLRDLRDSMLRIEGAKTVIEELTRYLTRIEESRCGVTTPETVDDVTGVDRS